MRFPERMIRHLQFQPRGRAEVHIQRLAHERDRLLHCGPVGSRHEGHLQGLVNRVGLAPAHRFLFIDGSDPALVPRSVDCGDVDEQLLVPEHRHVEHELVDRFLCEGDAVPSVLVETV